MNNYYTKLRNIQMMISLLKQHNIRKVIASPGTTHFQFLGSIQNDPFFEIYSSVDERSAAYMACGLAAESNEPVVLTCTGATASRNYVPGMTEAFYRKLPVIAITASPHWGKIGQNTPQAIDRTKEMNDIVKYVAQIPLVNTKEDEDAVNIELNNAMLELRHNGGGPVLINFTSTADMDFSVKELPNTHVIKRVKNEIDFPKIDKEKVGVFVGSHKKWDDELLKEVDTFCEKYNAVVICDQTSNYKGKYGISSGLISKHDEPCKKIDLLIDIGEVSGGYLGIRSNNAWRVNPDGVIRKRDSNIHYVFEMEEIDFFKHYNKIKEEKKETSFYKQWLDTDSRLRNKIQDNQLPFSNVWIALNSYKKVPKDSVIYLGILNTLRSWNFVPTLKDNLVFSNTGGFGIDGNVSSTIGAALANKDKIHFGLVGDLAFFYDMNSLGNRHVGNNVRIMVVNNGRGTEFRMYSHVAEKSFGDEADEFMAAAGHYGNMSKDLIKDYATNLGFEYLTAHNKEEYLKNADKFFDPKEKDKPILFEVFTNYRDESNALKTISNLEYSKKDMVKKIVGKNTINKIKKLLK